MCGLVGVIGDLMLDDKKVFDFLLKLDVFRGKHSTGVARVPYSKRKEVEIVKDVGTTWDLIEKRPHDYYNDYTNSPGPYIQGNYVALMGHNRWATVGAINPDNAHPFEAGKIIGCQNGTLPQWSIDKLDDSEFYDTDTEALMFNIDLHGVENVIPKISGAWALTWYNREEETFNILRNNERPLHFMWRKNKKVMIYASESWMLYAAIDKFNLDVWADKDGDSVFQFSTDTLYQYKFPNLIGKFSKDDVVKTPLKGYEAPKIVYYSSSNSNSAKESANVFKNYSGNSKPSPSFSADYWVSKVGQYFEFVCDGTVVKDEQRKDYIQASTVIGDAEIRIYTSAKNPDLKNLLSDKEAETFAAKIKRVKKCGKDYYLSIDYDSVMIATVKIKELDKKEEEWRDDDIPWEIVFGNETFSPENLNKTLDKGCCWCGYVCEAYDIPNVKWVGAEGDYLCADCKEDDYVKNYMTNFVS